MQQIRHHVEIGITLGRFVFGENDISLRQSKISKQESLDMRLPLNELADGALTFQLAGEEAENRLPLTIISHSHDQGRKTANIHVEKGRPAVGLRQVSIELLANGQIRNT